MLWLLFALKLSGLSKYLRNISPSPWTALWTLHICFLTLILFQLLALLCWPILLFSSFPCARPTVHKNWRLHSLPHVFHIMQIHKMLWIVMLFNDKTVPEFFQIQPVGQTYSKSSHQQSNDNANNHCSLFTFLLFHICLRNLEVRGGHEQVVTVTKQKPTSSNKFTPTAQYLTLFVHCHIISNCNKI